MTELDYLYLNSVQLSTLISRNDKIIDQQNIIIDLLAFILFFLLLFNLFPFYWKLFKKFSLKK